MQLKIEGALALVVSISLIFVLASSQQVKAQSAEQIIGLGAAIILNEALKQKQPQRVHRNTRRRPATRSRRQSRPTRSYNRKVRRRPSTPVDETVRATQHALAARGFDPGPADGKMGPQTRRAISAYQRSMGQSPTGQLAPYQLQQLITAGAAAGTWAVQNQAPGAGGGSFSMLDGYDLPGGDYRDGRTEAGLRNTSLSGCQRACASDRMCSGFTFNKAQNWCFLKTGALSPTTFSGAVSGLKQTQPPRALARLPQTPQARTGTPQAVPSAGSESALKNVATAFAPPAQERADPLAVEIVAPQSAAGAIAQQMNRDFAGTPLAAGDGGVPGGSQVALPNQGSRLSGQNGQLPSGSLGGGGMRSLDTGGSGLLAAQGNAGPLQVDSGLPMPTTRPELVGEIQERLNTLGYKAGSVDGLMGRRTRSSIRQWQRANGREETGRATRPLLLALRAARGDTAVAVAPGANTVSAIAGSRNLGAFKAIPQHADYVTLALKGDPEGYLMRAEEVGPAHLAATGTPSECEALRVAERSDDEFYKRDMIDAAARRFREVIASLENTPSSMVIAQDGTARLRDYNFAAKGFPLNVSAEFDGHGNVRSMSRADCSTRLGRSRGRYSLPFVEIKARYEGTPNVQFLPMSEAEARVLRASGIDELPLRVRTEIRAREQGQGPLIAEVVELVAIHPMTGAMIHDFMAAKRAAEAERMARTGDAVPLSEALVADLALPERANADDAEGASNVVRAYLESHSEMFDSGNVPSGFPLPVEEVRGKLVYDIYRAHKDALLTPILTRETALPKEIVHETVHRGHFDQRADAFFLRDFPGHSRAYSEAVRGRTQADPLDYAQLSGRDRPIYRLNAWGLRDRNDEPTYEIGIWRNMTGSLALELDRLIDIPALDATEEVRARFKEDPHDALRVKIRWRFVLDEVRGSTGRSEVLFASRLRGLELVWADNGAPLHTVDVESLRHMGPAEEAQTEATAAADGEAEAAARHDVVPPPEGAPFTAETADLMVLRDQPERVDAPTLDRMMVARARYEQQMRSNAQGQHWGSFFQDFDREPSAEERAALAGAFREWSLARAAALPAQRTLRLSADELAPMTDRRGFGSINSACNVSGSDRQRAEAIQRRCRFLKKASALPEPVLFVDRVQRGGRNGVGLRANCLGTDPAHTAYCQATARARRQLDLPGTIDLLSVNAFPALERVDVDDAVLEITIRPGAVAATGEPQVALWSYVMMVANRYSEKVGLNASMRVPEAAAPDNPVFLYEAEVLSARIVNDETGAVLRELELVEPSAPDVSMLRIDEAVAYGSGQDIAGLRLGQSFAVAERLIREHMDVGQVIERKRNAMQAAANVIEPFSSGKLFVSADQSEVIAIYDEPLVEPETIVGVWRSLRLPVGSIDPTSLDGHLRRSFGEPRDVSYQEANGGEMVSYVWAGVPLANQQCRRYEQSYWQQTKWRGPSGAQFSPAGRLLGEPVLLQEQALRRARQNNDTRQLCPARVMTNFLRIPAHRSGHATDELLSILVDQQNYVSELRAALGEITREATRAAVGTGVSVQ